MSLPDLQIHFLPTLAAQLGPDIVSWADALYDWYFFDDPDKVFGRDECNHRNGYTHTWARHMHVAPFPKDIERYRKWRRAKKKYDRTSDSLLVYSMDSADPLTQGILVLALLDPDGHKKLGSGAAGQARREIWENFAYAHQRAGDLPVGTITYS